MTTSAEFRGFWVDAFHDGIKTSAQVDQLLSDVKAAGANAVIVQVRRRGDAYYNRALEPRTQDPSLTPGFDALEDLLQKAHNSQPSIEVHAWLATLPIWNSATPPLSPDHVFNQHGPSAKGRDYWLMDRKDGVNRSGADYVLDPGHPDAVDYTVEQYLNVVREYRVDGIHLDLVRYMGVDWGYNPTSLERFQKQTGFTGIPDALDESWKEWRRQQVTHLVRKVYLQALAIRVDIKVSAAVIAWSKGPVTMEEYKESAPYHEVLQDWVGWMEQGIMDFLIPMNYDREHVADQKSWYDQWIEWEKDHQYKRQIAAGPGIYLNAIDGSIAQIDRTRISSVGGNRLVGACLYSYAMTNKDGQENSLFYQQLQARLFKQPVPTPDMPWKGCIGEGYVIGNVLDRNGLPMDNAQITMRGLGRKRIQMKTDGHGFFGVSSVRPGLYTLRLKNPPGQSHLYLLIVRGGNVTQLVVRAH
ncbi:Uncharacterized lipoprotein YddW, UPF0748 family [Marininema mesophilum]|uniref:Uncharacterized lipoprotein YddW, UPF0748 family n=1 Tax=Marininema mesophilum TaxID=1048340 RepID=A0A1H2SE28_9BACL|nr:family 10 glycosylhydrolase [Marininema mesophilum]SDW29825.1 Uncharacterized lipoprotein YddW, UPF0748 family [Marininema mesophilum]